MSAIAGIYNFHQEPVNPDYSRNLMNAFELYPADRIHKWCNDSIFFGCHAQWITPESLGEVLPYYDYDKGLVITADAIIDNRDELFDELRIKGNQPKSLPDSQLILLAYEKWGEEVPKHLIGDFAFMIWDKKNQKLFGARDFSGSRTLYFHQSEIQFAFSTTTKSLLSLPYVEKRLNEEWLAEFLAIPSMVEAVSSISTVYKDIQQIPPSHSICVQNDKVTLTRYCNLEANETLKLKSNEEYEEAFQEIFQKVVTSKIRTYGRVGAQLSGGLDSGSVVSFAAKGLRKENKTLHTFSYIPEDDFIDWTPFYFIPDERSYIKETVNYVGNINDEYLSFEGRSPLTELDEFLSIMEMPYKFFDNSFWLKGISEHASKQGIKVLLNGARGNFSISWGSQTLTLNHYASLLKKLRWLQLYKDLGAFCNHFKTEKSHILSIVTKKAFPRISNMLARANQENYKFPLLLNPELAIRTNVAEKLVKYAIDITGNNNEKPNDLRLNHFKHLYTWNKSGTANTKLSLQYGVLDRDPTNDLRVIRYCLSVPEEQYVTNGMERSLIRRATRNYLPDKVRLNQLSRGIQGADAIHRLTGSWKLIYSELKQLTKDSRIEGLLNIDVIKKALDDIGVNPRPEVIFDDSYRVLTRSLTVYRFIKNFTEGR
ncbi:asparagine synthase-related protein [Neobacillus citreus]|uniref:asparagine synthase (glutamine-hydrolyzing) n=1 Tax=Neobacillus citreus TaxID=2833578 RepID=A0A942T3R0_9BACI|nr:asparagine synthase-related protein [Neobacillus citreus]MCH6266021.1 asparagine synthase-related protein [Neobacillus citreus]